MHKNKQHVGVMISSTEVVNIPIRLAVKLLEHSRNDLVVLNPNAKLRKM